MIQLLIKLILPEPVTIVNTDSSCKPLKCWEKVSDLINSLMYHLWASEQFNQIYFILFWSLFTTSIVILTRHLCDFDWHSEYTKFPSEEYKSHIPWGQWFEYHNNFNFPLLLLFFYFSSQFPNWEFLSHYFTYAKLLTRICVLLFQRCHMCDLRGHKWIF